MFFIQARKSQGIIAPIFILSLIFNKSVNFKYKSERTKERSKVTLYSEALDFDNIDNPRSFTTLITFSSVRPRPRFQVVVTQVARSFINNFL